MIFTNILTILMVLFVGINSNKANWKRILQERNVRLFFAFYLMIFIGFLYDIPVKGVTNDLEKKLSFLIIPCAIFLIKQYGISVRKIFKIFFYFGFIIASYCFLLSLYEFIITNNLSELINHKFSMHVNMHATYLSMYLLFSIGYSIFYFNSIKGYKRKLITVVTTVIILVYILLLSARIVWILAFLAIIFLFIYSIYNYPHLRRVAISLFGGFILVTIIILQAPPIKKRFLETINYNNNYNIEKVWGGRGVRILIWNSCKELIIDKPYIGYGSSKEVQFKLSEVYRKKDYGPLLYMMANYNKVFNPHNQYLEELLKYGVLLGLYYPFLLIFSLFTFFASKNFYGVYLIFILLGVSATETILELNKGIVFFSFFLPLIWDLKVRRGSQKN
ncbi:O-antigen ligase family protein [Formosa undariae]|uniref:O-antigen ligase family protein n=1 Tax=Formosa undariae TaxID=1325436 RepID=A0ABV5EXX4_9FLAO